MLLLNTCLGRTEEFVRGMRKKNWPHKTVLFGISVNIFQRLKRLMFNLELGRPFTNISNSAKTTFAFLI